ncbi:hypothetical protein ACMD2_02879, partial [Ananas comosus]
MPVWIVSLSAILGLKLRRSQTFYARIASTENISALLVESWDHLMWKLVLRCFVALMQHVVNSIMQSVLHSYFSGKMKQKQWDLQKRLLMGSDSHAQSIGAASVMALKTEKLGRCSLQFADDAQ